MTLQYFELCIQVLTVIISLFYLKKYKTKFMFLLIILLFLLAITESIGAYLNIIKTPNLLLYKISSFFQFNIIALLYLELIKDKKWSRVILFLSVVFSVFWGVVFFYDSFFFYLIIVGAINTSLYVFLYLRELLLSNEILNYKKLLPFWVSVGFLVFYLPSIPFFTLFKYMKNRDLFFILHIFIIMMNLFIIFGLVWSKKEVKS